MQIDSDLCGPNPADLVRRCAWKNCAKSFQGRMPVGWERLKAEGRRKLGENLTASELHSALCPKHAFDAGQ
jgi:hypothetical protein